MHNLSGIHSAKKLYHQISQKDHSPHAYLFYGARGSGKTTLALEFAKLFLNNHNLLSTSQVDFLWIQSSSSSSWIRLANIINQDKDIEQPALKDFLLTPPLIHKFKVIVIEEAHKLTLEAAHALLKTLEEPPSFAKFILTTSHRHEVLPTIISRCININCELPSQAEQEQKWPFTTATEAIFSANAPGRRQHIQNHLDIYQKLYNILKESSNIPKFKAAEKFRIWGEQYAKQTGLSARQAFIEGLECLALWFLYLRQYQKVQKVCQVHKMIRFNPHLPYLIDALMVEVL